MNTESIIAGIWSAKNKRELTLHMDRVETAIDIRECSYSLSDELDFKMAIIEVIDNNFQRVLH